MAASTWLGRLAIARESTGILHSGPSLRFSKRGAGPDANDFGTPCSIAQRNYRKVADFAVAQAGRCNREGRPAKGSPIFSTPRPSRLLGCYAPDWQTGQELAGLFPIAYPGRPSALTFERLHWKLKNKNKWDASEIRGCFRRISSAEQPARCSAKCQPVIVRWTKARFPSCPYDDELVLA